MNVYEGNLPGVKIFEPEVHVDSRGDFRELWNVDEYADYGLDVTFVQDNLSRSRPNVLRGLHFQNPNPQGKLVSVLEGEVYDVAVDIRKESDTFGDWEGITLSAQNARQFYVPEGFAHGFVVTSDTLSLFHYKCTDFYNPNAEASLQWNDPALGIDWPVHDPILSDKDQNACLLTEFPEERLHVGETSVL